MGQQDTPDNCPDAAEDLPEQEPPTHYRRQPHLPCSIPSRHYDTSSSVLVPMDSKCKLHFEMSKLLSQGSTVPDVPFLSFFNTSLATNSLLGLCGFGRDMRALFPPLRVSTTPLPDLDSSSHNTLALASEQHLAYHILGRFPNNSLFAAVRAVMLGCEET